MTRGAVSWVKREDSFEVRGKSRIGETIAGELKTFLSRRMEFPSSSLSEQRTTQAPS